MTTPCYTLRIMVNWQTASAYPAHFILDAARGAAVRRKNQEEKTMVQQLSDAELEIMKIVWGNPREVTLFPYIMDGLAVRGRPCQKNTLIVLLSRLMNKGFLSAKKIGRRNECTTLISETEYQTAQTKNFLDKIYEGSVKGLVSALISGDLLTDEEYDELKMLLEKGSGKS